MSSTLSRTALSLILIVSCIQFAYTNQGPKNKGSSKEIKDRLIIMVDKKVALGRFSQALRFSRKSLKPQDIKHIYTHALKLTDKRYAKMILKDVFETVKVIVSSGEKIESFAKYVSNFSAQLSSKQIQELFVASIKGGGQHYVISFIKVGAKVNVKEKYGPLPLEVAFLKRRFEVAKLLYAHGARSSFRNQNLHDTFINAIARNNLKLVNFMIKIGVDVNRSARNGQTPLVLAIQYGNIKLVKKMIKSGAKLTKWSAGPRGLIIANATRIAVMVRKREILELLLSLGATLDQMPSAKYPKYRAPTELLIALHTNNNKLVKYLLDQGASIRLASKTLKGRSIYHFLSNDKRIGLLNTILTACIDINAWKKKHGTKPYKCKATNNITGLLWTLHYAVKKKEQVIIDRLIDFGILNMSPRAKKRILAMAIRAYNTDLIKKLEKEGIKLPTHTNYKLLIHAVEKGYIKQVKYILSSTPDAKYSDIAYLFDLAIARKHIEIAKILYKKGFKSERYNGLHIATIFIDANEIKKQISLGVNIDSKTKYGDTALLIAADKNLTASVIALLKYKPEINFKEAGGTALSYAIENENIKLVKILLKAGANPNIFWNKRVPLNLAIEQNNKVVFDLLVKHGARPDVQDSYGSTPLMTSAYMKDPKFLSRLLSIKQNINILDKSKRSVLHYAAKSGNADIVKLVITKKPTVNIQDNKGQTPLHFPVKMGYFKITQLLLTLKPNLEIKNKAGNTVLAEALYKKRKKIIALLLKHGSNPDEVKQEYITNLVKDKWSNNISTAKLILSKLSNVKMIDHKNNSLVTLAVLRKDEEAFQLLEILVKKGADINYKVSGKYNIGFRFATKKEMTLPIVKLLVKHGLDLKSKGRRGQSLLAEAIHQNNKSLIDFYIKKGMNIEDKDSKGRTPLLYFIINIGHKPKDALTYLLSKGANINVNDQQGTPLLSLAIKNGDMEQVIALINAKAKVNQGDSSKKTPLMYAASHNATSKVINYLIANGAKVKAKDDNNKSVLEYCKTSECQLVIKKSLKTP